MSENFKKLHEDLFYYIRDLKDILVQAQVLYDKISYQHDIDKLTEQLNNLKERYKDLDN